MPMPSLDYAFSQVVTPSTRQARTSAAPVTGWWSLSRTLLLVWIGSIVVLYWLLNEPSVREAVGWSDLAEQVAPYFTAPSAYESN